MQSRAKIHHFAVLTGELVKFKFPKVFLRFSSTHATKFGRSLTPGNIIFVVSSCSFDCNPSPDAWTLGLWDSLRPDDDEACCSLFGTQRCSSKSNASGSVTREFLLKPGNCNQSPDACLGSSDCGTLCNGSPDASDTWQMQSVAQCLAWIYLTFDIGLRLFLSCDQW